MAGSPRTEAGWLGVCALGTNDEPGAPGSSQLGRKPMKTKKKYTVTFERDQDGWWVATVAELDGCFTQGRSISQARERIREAMGLYDVPATVPLDERISVGGKLDAELAALRAQREEADHLARESAERTKRVADGLAKAGLSRRDAAELLGVSFQRVQQLTGKK